MKNTVSAMRIWHGRYLCEIKANIEKLPAMSRSIGVNCTKTLNRFLSIAVVVQAGNSVAWFCFAFSAAARKLAGDRADRFDPDPYYKDDSKPGKSLMTKPGRLSATS